MIHILIIQKDEEEIVPLHKALEHFEDIKTVIVSDNNGALELLKKQYFELILLDARYNHIEAVKELKNNNPETMIVSFNSEYNSDFKEKMFALGVKDCISKSTDAEVMTLRLKNYFEIIALKKQRLFHRDAVNLFDNNIYQRLVTFKLNSQTGRVEFWDYFMNEHFQEYENMEASIGVLYAFASWMFLNNRECEIIKETSRDALYLTIQPIDFINDTVIDDIVMKYDSGVVYLKKDHKLSLKLNHNTANIDTENISEEVIEIDDEKKRILGKTHFNKLSAAEFVATTAISYMSKIDSLVEVEDDIDAALITFEEEPTVEKMQAVANRFLEYIEVIKLLVEFDHIVFAIATLAKGIQEVAQDQLTPKEVKKFTTLTLHLVHDITNWRENIFIKQEANDIHYLDSSLLSSCLQIETIFANKEIEEEEDNFELF